jgi:hypothetical protein
MLATVNPSALPALRIAAMFFFTLNIDALEVAQCKMMLYLGLTPALAGCNGAGLTTLPRSSFGGV